MRVYKDLISGDELISDSYPQSLINDETTLEVRARYTKKASDNIQIASDDVADDDEEGETVVDVVEAFKLNEMTISKGEFMAWAKAYLPKVTAKLTEAGKEDRVPVFKKGATQTVKLIAGKFDEFQIFVGPSYNMEGALAFAYQKNQEDEGPTFLFFVDGMKEEKF
jgi:hypothetical protein